MTKSHPEDYYAPGALEVRVSELLVATADGGDALINRAVPDVLRLMREKLQMDAVFVSEFVDGRRVHPRVEAAASEARIIEAEQLDQLEISFGKRLVDDRLHPMSTADGAYLSAPVVFDDGRVYGTLCCFSSAASSEHMERDLRTLEMSARLMTRRIDGTQDATAAQTH